MVGPGGEGPTLYQAYNGLTLQIGACLQLFQLASGKSGNLHICIFNPPPPPEQKFLDEALTVYGTFSIVSPSVTLDTC